MFTIILVMGFGILLGWLFRKRKLPFLGKVINVLIWVLLFLLGVEVGSDERIVNGIATLGLEGIAIAVAAVIGSVLLAYILWKAVASKSRLKENEG